MDVCLLFLSTKNCSRIPDVCIFAKLKSLNKRDFDGAKRRAVKGVGASSQWVCLSQDVVSSSALIAVKLNTMCIYIYICFF